MRRVFWRAAVIACCLVGISSSAPVAQEKAARLKVSEEFIKDSIGTEWFGIYLKSKKIGYAKSSFDKVAVDGEPVYQSQMHLKVKAKSAGVPFELDIIETMQFDAKPPYALRGGNVVQQQGTAKQVIGLVRGDNGFTATNLTNGQRTRKEVGPIDYNLGDTMTSSLWIKKQPKLNEKLTSLGFDFDKFKTDLEHFTVTAIRESKVKGVNVKYYEIEVYIPSQKMKMLERLDAEGGMISGKIGGIFEMRKETEEQAKNLQTNIDLFVMGLVRIDRPLGKPSKITSMEVELLGDEANLVPSGPWQKVIKSKEGKLICRVGKEHGVKIKATPEQIAKSLEPTNSYPCKHPKVKALAEKAIGDAKTDREKVERLVKFVHEFIRPSFGGKGMVVLDLMEKKKGDCTAYAALFTTLARAAGLPAREVSGFAYMGDSQKSFGGHAWNEVVIDGFWHPIDASTGAVDPDAARICLGSDQDGGLNFLRNFGSLSVRLIDVQPDN